MLVLTLYPTSKMCGGMMSLSLETIPTNKTLLENLIFTLGTSLGRAAIYLLFCLLCNKSWQNFFSSEKH